MAINQQSEFAKRIVRMGDARLLLRARDVTAFNTPELHSLLNDMRSTMSALDGVGLAAPQLGIPLRVIIFGVESNPRYPDEEPVAETALINPVITWLNGDMNEDWEGCLSLPGMRGKVPRANSIRYRGKDEYGNLIDRVATGFHARVVQHECDHLDGFLYPMRMRDLSQFGFTDLLFPTRKSRDE